MVGRHPYLSTTVEITIGYLTLNLLLILYQSTTVEITIGYLTKVDAVIEKVSTTVEITIGYLTLYCYNGEDEIYNSRNYYRLLNFIVWQVISV